MCGIAGIYAPPGERQPRRAELSAMIRTLHHRGPDGYGYYSAPQVGLAHARLSIIDLATGGQPIRNEDGTVWVVLNGEVFNYIELRDDLKRRGHTFYTSSDTEVLVHLYEEFGERLVDHLNGQFAIALWDARRQRLLLARDRVGIRPLYYAWSEGRLLFGSEVKALLAEGGLEPRLDTRSLIETFSYWSPLEGHTAFQGVDQLAPGSLMVVDGNRVRTERYWDWSFDEVAPNGSTSADTVEELCALLEDAVHLQLRSDVPVGTYLSGGLDSSAITSITHRITRSPVRAYSLAFESREFDESDFQRAMERTLSIDRTECLCSGTDIAEAFVEALWHIETPIVRTAPIPLMLLSRRVRESGLKVVLTGEGADEVFAGYDLFREAKIRRWMARNPASRWRGRLLERLYPYLSASPTQQQQMSQQFFSAGLGDPNRTAFAHLTRIRSGQRALRLLSPDLRREAGHFDAPGMLEGALPGARSEWPALCRDQYVEAHTLLAGYLLSAQGDRVAMANSIEGRVPFLDHRVIEFAGRLPPTTKLSGLREKHILKRAVERYVPAEIRNRIKQPYRAPDSQSFFSAGQPHDVVDELTDPQLLGDAGYFEPNAVHQLVEKCRLGRSIGFGDNMAFVGILSTMALHKTFMKRAAFRERSA